MPKNRPKTIKQHNSSFQISDHYIFKKSYLDKENKKRLSDFVDFILKQKSFKDREDFLGKGDSIKENMRKDKFNNIYHVLDCVFEKFDVDYQFEEILCDCVEKFFGEKAYEKLIDLKGKSEEFDLFVNKESFC